MNKLNTEDFKSKIYNFTESKNWKYEGNSPVVIKLGAEWCTPCKVVERTMAILESEYLDDVDFYSVDIDEESDITTALGIQSVPTIYFINSDGNKIVTSGTLSIDKLREKIDELL